MVDSVALQQIPEQRVLVASAQIAEMISAEEMQEAWQHISAQAAQFLKFRILATSDAEARHLLGHQRKDKNPSIPCGCGRRQDGWTDLRESTMASWKHNAHFMTLYNALQRQPVMHAAVRLQGLAPAAVAQYERILEPGSTAKDSTIRLAAKDVLEATGLKQTEGVNVRHNAVVNASAVESMQVSIALERYKRGYEISGMQRRLLAEAGYQMEQPEEPGTVTIIRPDGTERTLDGEDVQVVWDDAGDENQDYLPD